MKIGYVTGIMLDEDGAYSPEIQFRCYFALNDEIPIILGFKDFLEKFIIHIDAPNKEAFLSF